LVCVPDQKKLTIPTADQARRPLPAGAPEHPRRRRRVARAAALAGVLASVGLCTSPASATNPKSGRAAGHAPGTIFVANYDASSITSYPLANAGTAAPKVTIYGTSSPQGVCFDSSGDLWVGTGDGVVEYAKSQLSRASPIYGVIVISNSGGSSGGLAFDSSGDLWVDGYGNDNIVEYAKSQLAKSGSPKPKVTISNDIEGDLSAPFGLAFDRSGNLWVGNENTGEVIEYAKSQLAKSGSPKPKVALSTGGAEEVAFDSSGDLWVADPNGEVAEYTKNQLTKASPYPEVTISSGGASHGLAFDSAGDLWVANYDTSTVEEFTKAQLRTSGAPTPRQTINEQSGGPVALAIEP
jgi:ligand-binding sensor domain-containing protein